MPNEMIYQDCLRVVDFDQEGHEGEYSCVCGGDFCGCEYCQDLILLLRSGSSDPVKYSHHFENGFIPSFWSPAFGFVNSSH